MGRRSHSQTLTLWANGELVGRWTLTTSAFRWPEPRRKTPSSGGTATGISPHVKYENEGGPGRTVPAHPDP